MFKAIKNNCLNYLGQAKLFMAFCKENHHDISAYKKYMDLGLKADFVFFNRNVLDEVIHKHIQQDFLPNHTAKIIAQFSKQSVEDLIKTKHWLKLNSSPAICKRYKIKDLEKWKKKHGEGGVSSLSKKLMVDFWSLISIPPYNISAISSQIDSFVQKSNMEKIEINSNIINIKKMVL